MILEAFIRALSKTTDAIVFYILYLRVGVGGWSYFLVTERLIAFLWYVSYIVALWFDMVSWYFVNIASDNG